MPNDAQIQHYNVENLCLSTMQFMCPLLKLRVIQSLQSCDFDTLKAITENYHAILSDWCLTGPEFCLWSKRRIYHRVIEELDFGYLPK